VKSSSHQPPASAAGTADRTEREGTSQAQPVAHGAQRAQTAGEAGTVNTSGWLSEVALAHPSRSAQRVRAGAVDARLPASSLFRTHPEPASRYLVETDPRFADQRQWLSSDVMLQALALDPAQAHKRLGDGYYEQRLVREQVSQLTGRRFLDGYADDEDQYRALLNAGTTFAKRHDLRPGVALSEQQMAQLTSDIVWLVEQQVQGADGSMHSVLVPRVYAMVRDGDIDPSGALISGNRLALDLSGDLHNSGTLAGRSVVQLTAQNIRNLNGRIAGEAVNVAARQDLHNLGGTIEAASSLAVQAGRDLNVASTTHSASRSTGQNRSERTVIDRVAGLYVTGDNATLLASAGRDLQLDGAALQSQGAVVLQAGRDIALGTATTTSADKLVWDRDNHVQRTESTEHGSRIEAQQDIALIAGRDITTRAADITSRTGALTALAERHIDINAGQSDKHFDEAHRVQSNGFLSSTTTTTRNSNRQSTAQASTLSAERVQLQAGADITVQGSNVVSTHGTALTAGRDIRIQAAAETSREQHFKDVQVSGLMSSGLSITYGEQQQTNEGEGTRRIAAASTVGSTEGDIHIQAGNAYKQTGSHVLAPQGDIAVQAKSIEIKEARQQEKSTQQQHFEQSGLTVALGGTVISAVQSAQQMMEAGQQTGDGRMQLLAAANAGASAYDAATAAQAAAQQAQAGEGTGSAINVSITVGSSRSDSRSEQSANTAAGSTMRAGGDISLNASGAGRRSDIVVQGSEISAGANATLRAEGDIALQAASNTVEQHSTHSSSSASVGVAVTLGADGVAFGFTANASLARGNADGKDQTWSNTHVSAGNTLTVNSGNDTTLSGAVAAARQVQAEVGGNLTIKSLQDTSVFDSKDENIGVSATFGAGFSASVTAGRSKVQAGYAGVQEQSGISAGDGGFDVAVKGNTDLQGGLLASSQAAVDANKNRLVTGTLTTADLQNHSSVEADSTSVSLSTDMASQGKYGVTKAVLANVLGGANGQGDSSSRTRSAISAGSVLITDEAAQQRTGQTASETVASLNRDTTDAHKVVQRQDIEAMQAQVQAEAAIKQQAYSHAAKLTDEAYRVIAQEKARIYEAPRGCSSSACATEVSPEALQKSQDGEVHVANHGVYNNLDRATLQATQNAYEVEDVGDKDALVAKPKTQRV
jgi:filamentous hemagglutinin